MWLTAKQLGISDQHRAALVLVMEKLRSGEIVHSPWCPTPPPGQWFSMAHWTNGRHDTNCGTIACIGGWAERLGGVRFSLDDRPADIDELFYPNSDLDWDLIDNAAAVKAIQNYLSTGKPDWKSIVGSG